MDSLEASRSSPVRARCIVRSSGARGPRSLGGGPHRASLSGRPASGEDGALVPTMTLVRVVSLSSVLPASGS